MLKKIKDILRIVVNLALASFPDALIAERIIKRNMSEEDKGSDNKNLSNIPIDIFHRHDQKSLENKSTIEGKAKTNLLAITLAFSVIAAGFGLMTDKSIQVFLKGSQGLFIFLPLLIGAFYLLLGGLAALRALEIGKWYEVGLEDEFHLSEEGTKKSKMRRCVKLNNLTNLIRTNYTFVSYKAIRNGIIFLGLYAFLMAGFLLFSGDSKKVQSPMGNENRSHDIIETLAGQKHPKVMPINRAL